MAKIYIWSAMSIFLNTCNDDQFYFIFVVVTAAAAIMAVVIVVVLAIPVHRSLFKSRDKAFVEETAFFNCLVHSSLI